jgi:phenylpropionate dioxygenase-like ring-hydroxylating dioxygenase large terminal subunit
MADLTAHFHPVLRASRLRDRPVRVEIGSVGYVLWRDRDRDRTPRALLDRCPHRHAPLSKGRVRSDGRLACGYHGWHFDGTGDGRSPAVPNLGACTVPAMQIVEQSGWLWLAGAAVSIDRLPDMTFPGWDFIGSHAQRADAPLHVVVDNFSENEHTPYVHDRLGWREEDAARVQVETRCEGDRTEVTYVAPQRPSVLLPLVLVQNGDTLHNEWVTRFSPIHSVYTLTWRDPRGATRPYALRVAIYFVPESETTTNIVSFMFSRLTGRSWVPRRMLDATAFAMGWKEVWDDKRWVRHVAGTQLGFEGMRLTRFDKPLAHNRKLATELYFADPIVTLRKSKQSGAEGSST